MKRKLPTKKITNPKKSITFNIPMHFQCGVFTINNTFFLTIKKKMKKLFFLKIFYGDGYP